MQPGRGAALIVPWTGSPRLGCCLDHLSPQSCHALKERSLRELRLCALTHACVN